MLYDNSQLARVYLHAWQVTGNEFFRTITEEILDYVVREMLAPEGGFFSTQDAGSEGEEGKFFVWTPDEIRAVLGDEADAFVAARKLAETMLERFTGSEGALYDTSDDHETLITRPRDLRDNATPSGNAMAVTTLLKLASFTNEICIAMSDRRISD